MSKKREPVPPEQGALFREAKRGRDEAINAVALFVDPAWAGQALTAIRKTAETHAEFISDDVWRHGKLAPTRENRALGAVFKHAVALGWMTRTNRSRASVRSHLSGKPIWKSLIYKGGAP
jgi:hypothetical protein